MLHKTTHISKSLEPSYLKRMPMRVVGGVEEEHTIVEGGDVHSSEAVSETGYLCFPE